MAVLKGRTMNLLRSIPVTTQWRTTRLPMSSVITRGVKDAAKLNNDAEVAESDDDAQTTGVINKTGEESMLYFDHILPHKVSKWDIKHPISLFLMRKSADDLKQEVLELAQSENTPIPDLKITSFVTLERDGGAFVKFRVPEGYTPGTLSKSIQKNTANKSRNTFFHMLTHPVAYTVKGIPWIEDLRRYPSPKLRIEFAGDAFCEEELYVVFRRYGKIIDIAPQRSGSIFAYITFATTRSAIAAKNCITGLTLEGTSFHLQYEPIVRASFIRDMIVNHTRIAVPIFIALLAAGAVLIFDPIREWFVEQKVTHTFSKYTYKDSFLIKAFMGGFDTATGYLGLNEYFKCRTNHKKIYMGELWSERYENIKQLKLWFEENVNTFIIVRGPRGSGKHDLVMDHALRDRKNVLLVDCEKLVKSRTDSNLIKNTAHELGYFPVFPWINSISSFIDLAVQGLTGQKSGLSESKDSQVKNMLSVAAQSIRNISLYGFSELEDSSEDAIKEEDYLQQHPEQKPVVVIDRFMRKSENNEFVYKLIAEWAATLVSTNVAHVVVITDDIGSVQHLSDALPNQIFKNITLADASESSSAQFVLNQIGEDYKNLEDLHKSIAPLGGRMLDLQAFSRRIKSGETPSDALDEMINQSAEQVTQMFISRESNEWSGAQVWELLKLLTANECVPASELYKSPVFKSNPEKTLSSLEKNELIIINREKGLLKEVKPGKPLFRAAFQNLVHDPRVFGPLETAYFGTLIKDETLKIQKMEEELQTISRFVDVRPFKARINYLSDKITASTNKIIEYEGKVKDLGK